jgi:hypothetical protein
LTSDWIDAADRLRRDTVNSVGNVHFGQVRKATAQRVVNKACLTSASQNATFRMERRTLPYFGVRVASGDGLLLESPLRSYRGSWCR